MNKQEKIIVTILAALLGGWLWHQSRITPDFHERLPESGPGAAAPAGDSGSPKPAVPAPATSNLESPTLAAPSPPSPQAPETTITQAVNGFIVEFTSRGGIKSVTLENYPASMDPQSPPLTFHFSNAPALMMEGIFAPGQPPVFELVETPGGDGITLRAETADGTLEIERKITIPSPYLLQCRDSIANRASSVVLLPTNLVWSGVMHRGGGKSRMDMLGVDVMHALEPRKVEHWEKKLLPGLFGASAGGCFGGGVTPGMPVAAEGGRMVPTDWIASKNKFFTQSLRSQNPADGIKIVAFRNETTRAFELESVRTALVYAPLALAPGKAFERDLRLYIGPKKLDLLRSLGHGQDEIMQFGFFKWLCKILLPTLNGFHRIIPNYGVAIILLTLLVRIIFWPLTHRSTESMKKMQLLQPKLKELQKKYKDEPQKLQQETWKIYRENKVNPMASCLPMLVQIPVFIALFTVLRSAVELRFASFLWIQDLSEPENLLAGALPLPLNILPLLMTATMIWQQKLTPSSGDPQQKRMMMIMPVMMLVMFYSMPSALVLYWTVSQMMSIFQLVRQRKKAAAEAPESGEAEQIPEHEMTRQMRRRLQNAKKVEPETPE